MHSEPQPSPLPWHLLLRMLAAALTLGLALWSTQVTAQAQERQIPTMLVPVGQTVGIKLFSDGVIVVGLSDLAGEAPAERCGLQQGDIITHINDTQVDTIEQVREVLQDLEGEPMSIRADRGEEQVQFTAQAVACSDGSYKLGAWIRDSMAGIGTMTFYDPATGQFGALGHSINDLDTALVMPLERGSIMPSTVTGVKKGQVGSPGELQGSFEVQHDVGNLYLNSIAGIFGVLEDDEMMAGRKAFPVATAAEIQVGPATILSNIDGTTVQEFEVNITHLAKETGDPRNMMIEVTDPALLAATGGIVQGMSGSPILQNGKLIGAVTHVLVNSPSQGYGIFIETMLETGTQ